MFDLIITNAQIVDGSGRAPYQADVAIKGPAIATIGDLKDSRAIRRVDAAGKTLCPGFIDVHSHADLTLFRDDYAETLSPLLRQGITTFVGGHCGIGLSPLTTENREGLKTYLEVFAQMDFEHDIRWDSMASFMDHVSTRGLPTNMALLVPHGLLRICASGLNNRLLDFREIQVMQRLLEEGMEAGAFGLSSGLQYAPGLNADTGELIELARPLAKYQGIHASHIRSYTSSTLPQAIGEIGEISRRAGIHGHIAHIFSVPWAGPFQNLALKGLKWLANHAETAMRLMPKPLINMEMKRILGLLEKERHAGAEITMDIMPTTVGFTHLLAFFPPWALVGGQAEVIRKIRDKTTRVAIRRDIETGKPTWPHRGRNTWSLNIMRQMGWDAVTIMAVHSEKNKALEGRRFTEIADERGMHPFDVMCELLLEEDGRVLVFESMSEPDDAFTEAYTFPALLDKRVMITTDTILLGMGKPSYLFYGCYPKFIGRYVYERGLLDLPTAIHRCTGLPAREFGIENRGLIKEGYYADILLMDAPNFRTKAAFRDPEQFPKGLAMVVINGQVVLENDTPLTGLLSGMMIKKQHQNVPKV
ncbi:MAG: amidohydrolase family protein [Syntrophaceae bacterium]